MQAIWKFTLPIDDRPLEIEMPRESTLLAVQVQHGEPRLWALVVPGRLTVRRKLRIVGTGWERADLLDLKYVGTFQQGAFVFHLFDEGEVPV